MFQIDEVSALLKGLGTGGAFLLLFCSVAFGVAVLYMRWNRDSFQETVRKANEAPPHKADM